MGKFIILEYGPKLILVIILLTLLPCEHSQHTLIHTVGTHVPSSGHQVVILGLI